MLKSLLIWECGQDLGHISHLSSIALILKDLNCETVFCLKDKSYIQQFFHVKESQIIPFPKLNEKKSQYSIDSIVHLLHRRGFSSTATLSKQTKKWQAIYNAVKPDIVIFDFAPTALFASRSFEFKKVIVDSTWGAPPPHHPFLPLNLWKPMMTEALEFQEAEVLKSMNQVSTLLGMPPLKTASDIFKADETIISNFPELDIYESLRQGVHYVGPISENNVGDKIKIGTDKKRIFGYLKADKKTTQGALSALQELQDYEIHLYVKGLNSALKNRLEKSGMRVYANPIALEGVFPKFDLVFCHAGAGTVGYSIKSGVPVLAFPTQLEQRNVGELLARSGAGLSVGPQEPVSSILEKVQELMKPKYRDNCLAVRSTIDNSISVKSRLRNILQPLLPQSDA